MGLWQGITPGVLRIHLSENGDLLDISVDEQTGVHAFEKPVELARRFGVLNDGNMLAWLAEGPLPIELRSRLGIRPTLPPVSI